VLSFGEFFCLQLLLFSDSLFVCWSCVWWCNCRGLLFVGVCCLLPALLRVCVCVCVVMCCWLQGTPVRRSGTKSSAGMAGMAQQALTRYVVSVVECSESSGV